MNQDKDYYAILGIIPTAELEVIKAAYKAMLKVYHPDRFQGSKEEAHARSIEINEAYGVLSNTAKRKQYDDLRGNTKDKAYSYNEESKSQENYTDALDALEKDWQVAVKYQPELVELFNKLTKISSKLAFSFKAVMLESKEFDKKENVADKMEFEYLTSYFGRDKRIQSFAKALILGNHRDAARELNTAITVLGKRVDVERIIAQVKSEFNLNDSNRKNNNQSSNKSQNESEPLGPNEEDKKLGTTIWSVLAAVAILLALISVGKN
jgi:curved DNA-binding protein CbpA